MQAETSDYTVRVIGLTPEGIPMVADLQKDKNDRYWKFPGGGSKAKDRKDVFKTGRREYRGETGYELEEDGCKCIAHVVRDSGHHVYLIIGRAHRESKVPDVNVDGERVRVFSRKKRSVLLREGVFLPQHVELLKKAPQEYYKVVFPQT